MWKEDLRINIDILNLVDELFTTPTMYTANEYIASSCLRFSCVELSLLSFTPLQATVPGNSAHSVIITAAGLTAT